MKRMRRRTNTGPWGWRKANCFSLTALLGTLIGLTPAPGLGQGVVVGRRVCPPEQVVGDLGISGLDCVGECSVALSRDGKEESWSFSAEPRVIQMESGSPVDGVLQEGDFLVAIDGVLITTRDGGRRFANVLPGRRVRISYRRDGVVREALLVAGSKCAEPLPVMERGRVVPPPPPRPERSKPPKNVATAPRVRVISPPSPPDSAAVPRLDGPVGILGGGLLDSRPRGRLGLGFSCTRCGTSTDRDTGEEIWFFSGPLEVTQVNTGGPAEKAGIQMGDFITAVDGKELTTDVGGKAFSRLVPGEPVELTVTRRSGREERVTLVPTNRESMSRIGRAAPPSPEAVSKPRAPGVPARPPSNTRGAPVPSTPVETPPRPVVPGSMTGLLTGPDDLPLSYSGTVEGVEVVVRGGPVSVSELRDARTVIINSEGLWVRIRIPARAAGQAGTTGGGD